MHIFLVCLPITKLIDLLLIYLSATKIETALA